MQLIEKLLESVLKQTITRIYPDFSDWSKLFIQRTNDPQFGDFQTNFAMINSKVFGKQPKIIAEEIKNSVCDPIIEKVEIAGPGFINIFLKNEAVCEIIKNSDAAGWDFSFIDRSGDIIIDYSAPNIAKQMHIGHLRSTVIGDSLKRIFRFMGFSVIGDNHIGDWGTPFGKLIVGFRKWLDSAAYEANPIEELERLYVLFAQKEEEDPELGDLARLELTKLQSGDPDNRKLWKEFVDISIKEYNKLYDRMDISFDTWHGESFYHDMNSKTLEILQEKELAVESEGALCVFFDESENLPPFIVRKKDGGFNYATSDLSSVFYRMQNHELNRVIYVTDDRQQGHFKQLFATAKKLGFNLPLEHVYFGVMRFADGIFATRKGNAIKLEHLIDESVRRALEIIEEKNPSLPETEKKAIAEVVGIGAVKYSDLSQNRISTIIFEWDKVLNFEGNTAPYLQYTYARIKAIKRKADEAGKTISDEKIILGTDIERGLAMQLLAFPQALIKASENFRPNILADYLFELAQKFNNFYNSLSVLKEEDSILKSRLSLSLKTAEVLKSGLNLLGIKTVERM